MVELPDELVRALESSFVGIRESGVNELGKYLHSRDREMVELAISFLKQMKEDDSRRISSLAEKLLFEFSQVRSQTIKATSSKMIEPEPEIAEASNDELISSPETAAEIEPLSMPKTRAAQPVAGLVEAGTQQNIFFISLSLSLILYFLLFFSITLGQTSAKDIFTVLFGIADILVSLFYILKKEIPRNFGFIALVISSFLFGVMVEINHFNDHFSASLLSIPALVSLSSGLFFITQNETRKDFRFITLSVFLISVSIAQIARNIPVVYSTFSIIAAVCALATAICFFRNK